MSNKVALVTGGIGGIGTAVCQRLACEGYQVVANYYSGGDHAKAKAWQQSRLLQGYDIAIAYGDVGDPESARAMVADIRARIGDIDVLVNNAGITRDATLRKMQWEQWHSVLNTNLDSVFNVTREVIDGMVGRQFGRVISISSINAEKGQFGQANYSAAKAGILGFTRALAQEVAAKGVTVNAISPGYIDTDMVKKVPEEVREKIRQQIPVGRFGSPGEVAALVAFLAGDEAGFITGSTISANGGQHMC
ncbi:MAG: acetoacetyl-CoA reductase [Pseudomonadota bacterium]